MIPYKGLDLSIQGHNSPIHRLWASLFHAPVGKNWKSVAIWLTKKWLCRGRMIPYEDLDLSIQGHSNLIHQVWPSPFNALVGKNCNSVLRVDTEVDVQGAFDHFWRPRPIHTGPQPPNPSGDPVPLMQQLAKTASPYSYRFNTEVDVQGAYDRLWRSIDLSIQGHNSPIQQVWPSPFNAPVDKNCKSVTIGLTPKWLCRGGWSLIKA